jgi:hypothetical protein
VVVFQALRATLRWVLFRIPEDPRRNCAESKMSRLALSSVSARSRDQRPTVSKKHASQSVVLRLGAAKSGSLRAALYLCIALPLWAHAAGWVGKDSSART